MFIVKTRYELKMKRFIATICFGVTAALAFCQAPFTIVRPADGSRVREVVHVLIPKESVPPGGYIGIYAEGKFIEATILPTDHSGKFYVYSLDTQARKLADGPLTIEAVLFENFEDTPRIINRSSVTVTLQNSAANFMPQDGAYLRYAWPSGRKYVYTVYMRNQIEEGSNAQSSLGGRPTSQSADFQTFRYLYEVDNHYPNGDGLVRQQILPLKNHNRIFLATSGSTQPQYYNPDDANAVYLHLTDTGMQRWGAVPLGVPFSGAGASGTQTDLYGVLTLPSLPFERVHPGSSWASRFQDGAVNLADPYSQNSVVQHFPMRGEFVGVEWMMGHPCVHVRNTIAVGELSDEAKKAMAKHANGTLGNVPGNKVSLTQDYWFALDDHEVVKIHTVVTTQEKASFMSNFGGGAPGSGMPPGMPGGRGMPPGMPPGVPRGPGAPGIPGGGAATDSAIPLGLMQFKGKGGGPAMGGLGRPGGPGFGGFGRPGGSFGGPTATQGFIRVKKIITMVLNQ